MDTPTTLLDAVRHFSNLDTCHAYMLKLKWPDGRIICAACGSEAIGHITTRRLLRCKDCRKQFSAKVGTIFEDSPLGLDKWFTAVWLIANAKNGISSMELHRALGVRQPTAWFMLHRIRLAMKTGTFRKLSGVVESDETNIDRNVDRNAVVITDKHASYAGLFMRYVHHAIDHATEYVRGKVHVNGMENFWCLLKRMIRGTYVAVAPFHLDRYLDEEAWRFNPRNMNDGTRFNVAMQGVLGKRLTFRYLCAIDDAGFMGLA